jgi:predicted amidophosphoribosyltransferase
MLLARAGLRVTPVFAPARAHRAQKSLSVADRRSNLDGAFRLRRPVVGRRFLLVDDVVTTGATLLEAARTLREGGADVLGAATVATTPRRFRPNDVTK